MSDIVTGEAVALDLRLARLPSRGLALLIDVIVQVAGFVLLTLVAGALVRGADPALAAAIQLMLTVAVLVGYPVLLETLWRGRTLGKAALGLRVVRDDGGPVRFRQALVRGLLAFFVDIWTTLGIGALLSSTLSSRGKRVGDVLAGTVVVRERAPARVGPAPVMPPPLAAWAASADLSRVGDDLALSARQLLGRAPQLTPAAYGDLALRLASAVAALVAPPPPSGTPPAAYLAAVLAERRRREDERLGRLPVSFPGAAPVPPPTSVAAPAPASAPPPAPPPPAGGFALPG